MGKRRCVVVGGGLGGLSAALALGQKGHEVTLLEQAPQIEPIGYGIQLGPNVMSLFERFGILPEVYSHAHFPSAIQMVDAVSGKSIAEIPLGDRFLERFRHRYICIHRSDIHKLLLEACATVDNIELRKGISVSGYAVDGDRAVAQTQGHGDTYGDVLIGADGFNSRLRAQMHPKSQLQPIGYVAHRSIVPFDRVPEIVRRDQVVMWAGDGAHLIYYPLPGYGMNFVAVFSEQGSGSQKRGEARRDELLERCRGAHPEMLAVLGVMNFENGWELADRRPLTKWVDGPAALLGDAIHPTFQSLAQGACMAIEDAVVLADCIDTGQSIDTALQDYEKKRLVRTARVQLESRALWTTYHVGGIEAAVRDQQFEGRSAEDYYDCLSWVWSGIPAARRQ